MEIILKLKGFVTNSSSANYWLEDLDEDWDGPNGGNTVSTTTDTVLNIDKETTITQPVSFSEQENKNQFVISKNNNFEEAKDNFFIWLFFSLILIVVLFLKKIRKI